MSRLQLKMPSERAAMLAVVGSVASCQLVLGEYKVKDFAAAGAGARNEAGSAGAGAGGAKADGGAGPSSGSSNGGTDSPNSGGSANASGAGGAGDEPAGTGGAATGGGVSTGGSSALGGNSGVAGNGGTPVTGGESTGADGGSATGGVSGGTGGVSTGGVSTGGVPGGTGGSSTTPCSGERYEGICWYVGQPAASCNQTCANHGGVAEDSASYVGTETQGGSLEKCAAVLEVLGISGTVAVGERSTVDGRGLGCHVFPDDSLWWLEAPDFDAADRLTEVRIVCGCLE